MKSDKWASKVTNGWWMGNIVTVQTGYPFTAAIGTIRSDTNGNALGPDRPNVNTTSVTQSFPCTGTASTYPGGPACNGSTVTYNFIPYDPKTVSTGNPNSWFNPLMFSLSPLTVAPGGAVCTTTTCSLATNCGTTANPLICAWGTLGNAGRDTLEGPGLGTWNFSIAKDTKLGFLGEAGSVEFRAEFFNLLNRANFGSPNGNVFTGGQGTAAAPNYGAFSQQPSSTVGQIQQTTGTSRQIQLALKVIF